MTAESAVRHDDLATYKAPGREALGGGTGSAGTS